MQQRYTDTELKEFEDIIREKLKKGVSELKFIMEAIARKNENTTDNAVKSLADSAVIAEKENLTKLAERQRKFIVDLERALVRINNGTYGICIVTGELISKERLKLVPHTRHSLAAKLMGLG